LDIPSLFCLSLTSKKYRHHEAIRLMLFKYGSVIDIIKIHHETIIEGHTHLFEWLVDKDKIPTLTYKKYAENAIIFNRIEILKYLHNNNYPQTIIHSFLPYSVWAHSTSADYGHLEMMKYLHESGLKWYKTITYWAARGGNINILKFLRENGCSFDRERNYEYAIQRGHLKVVKYLHQNGCPWDEYSCYTAAREGHLEILKYLHDNGCPLDRDMCLNIARKNDHMHIVEYLKI